MNRSFHAFALAIVLALVPSLVHADPISLTTALISAAVATEGFAVGITLFGVAFTVFETTALIIGSSLLMGGLQKAFAPKPKSLSFSSSSELRGRTVTVRQPIFPRRFLYGEARIGGFIIFFEETNNKKFLHVVIGFCEGEIEAIDTVYLGDIPVFSDMLDGAGLVTEGKFKDKVRIIKHLGSATQAADADLVSEVGKWTTAHSLDGIAYLYARFEADRNLFPRGLPDISADIKGRKVFDPRTSTTIWTPNPVLCARDYMSDTKFGPGFNLSRIDMTFVNSAANICDEIVDTLPVALEVTNVDPGTDLFELSKTGTSNPRILPLETGDRGQMTTTGVLPGGVAAATNFFVIINHSSDISTGIDKEIKLASSYDNALAGTSINVTDAGSGTHTFTKNAEPRYTLHGLVGSDIAPGDNIEDMLASMAGSLVPSGGVWLLFAGAFQTPTVSFNEDILRGSVQVVTKHSGRDRFNGVKGIFASRLSEGQPTDLPVVTNATFEAEDGGRRVFQDLQFKYTNRPQTGQRISKIALAIHRQEISVIIKCKLDAFEIRANDTVQFTYEKAGWMNKDFRVVEWRLVVEADGQGVPYFGVDLSMRETDPSVYDFDETTEESTFDPAPDTNLPSSLSIAAPTGLTVTSGTAELFLKSDGTVVSRIKASWTASVDAFVDRYEVQFKKSAAVTFEQASVTQHPTVESFIWEVEDGVDYDVRVRAINSIGVLSDTADVWVQTVLNHTVIGKTEDPSNVTGFSAQQNDNVVTFKWLQVPDLDLAGYEIRFGPQPDFLYSDTVILTKVTRGTLVTNAGVPPGSHTVAIKAIDTSGNESTIEATFNITVSNNNDVVDSRIEHPRWTGILTNFIKHDVSGRLVPDSNDTAAGDNFNVFDTFVINPKAVCTYEAAEIDLGFDAKSVRLFAEVKAALGPGETTGIADPSLEIDFRDEAQSYDGFDPWTVGTVDARRVKMREIILTATGVAYLEEFVPTLDVAERTETRRGVTIDIGGTAITYTERFHRVPGIQITPSTTTALLPVHTAESETGFTGFVFNTAGTDVGGLVDWEATGP